MIDNRKTKDTEHLEKLKEQARLTCNRCYGRGHLGKNLITKEYIPCPCTQTKKHV